MSKCGCYNCYTTVHLGQNERDYPSYIEGAKKERDKNE